jgi:hypothetical protein
MTRIYDMTEEEILALTDDQINKLIDYECALEGAPMLPPDPGPKPTKDIPEPDVQAYAVAGFNVLDADHAGRILTALNSGTLYNIEYGRNYDVKYLSPITSGSYHAPKVEVKSFHSAELWDSIKDTQSAFAEQEKEWNRRKEIYNTAVEGRAKLTESVWEHVGNLRSHAWEREQIRGEFRRYMELAENNSKIALAFLQKVKDLSDFPELEKEFCPVENVVVMEA